MEIKKITINKDQILRVLEGVKTDLTALVAVVKLKGPKYFKRPLAIAAILIFASYYYFFQMSAKMLANISLEVESAQATASFAEEFDKLQKDIASIDTKLPKTKDPQEWLLTTIRRSLREEGIVPLSTSQAKTESRKGLQLVTISVELQASFPQVASWVSRLERNKHLLYIKTLSLRKDSENIGENSVTVQVMTIIKGGK